MLVDDALPPRADEGLRPHDPTHLAEIVAYFGHPYTNAVLEGADGVIRNVRRRARGFRDMDHFATMIYLTCGKLDLKAVTTTHHKQRIAYLVLG